jgi:tRNA pseudouridine55 synthase
MVSARKVGGRKLYELAREGIEVEREAREVEIYALDLLDFAPSPYPEVAFRTVCSTGTYVRTLADDIARSLGGRAHLSALRRVRNGSLHVRDAWSIQDIETAAREGEAAELILSPRNGLPDIPEVTVGPDLAAGVGSGLSFPTTVVRAEVPQQGPVRIVDESGRMLAVYRIEESKAFPEVVIA